MEKTMKVRMEGPELFEDGSMRGARVSYFGYEAMVMYLLGEVRIHEIGGARLSRKARTIATSMIKKAFEEKMKTLATPEWLTKHEELFK